MRIDALHRMACKRFGAGFLLLGLTQAAPAADLESMLRRLPADSNAVLVMANLAQTKEALREWHLLLRAVGNFGVEDVAALRDLFPFREWVDIQAPLAFQPPVAGTAAKAIYWLTIPGFSDKVRGLPTASEEDGLWRATDVGGTTWYAKPLDNLVVVSASRLSVESVVSPAQTMADDYAPFRAALADRDVLVHLKSDVYMARLTAALDALAAAPGAPAADVTTAIRQAAAPDLRRIAEQTRSIGLAFDVTPNAFALGVMLRFREGSVRSYLQKVQPGTDCGRELAQNRALVLGAAWCEPVAATPLVGPWLGRLAGPQQAPLTPAWDKLQRGVMNLSVRQGQPHLHLSLAGPDMASVRARLEQDGAPADGIRRLLQVLRGEPAPAADDRAYETLAALFPADAQFHVREAADVLTLNLGQAGEGDSQTPADAQRTVRDVIAGLPPAAQSVVLVDPAALLAAVKKARGEPVDLSTLRFGPPSGCAISMTPEGVRIDIQVPKAAMERLQEAEAPAGPT